MLDDVVGHLETTTGRVEMLEVSDIDRLFSCKFFFICCHV